MEEWIDWRMKVWVKDGMMLTWWCSGRRGMETVLPSSGSDVSVSEWTGIVLISTVWKTQEWKNVEHSHACTHTHPRTPPAVWNWLSILQSWLRPWDMRQIQTRAEQAYQACSLGTGLFLDNVCSGLQCDTTATRQTLEVLWMSLKDCQERVQVLPVGEVKVSEVGGTSTLLMELPVHCVGCPAGGMVSLCSSSHQQISGRSENEELPRIQQDWKRHDSPHQRERQTQRKWDRQRQTMRVWNRKSQQETDAERQREIKRQTMSNFQLTDCHGFPVRPPWLHDRHWSQWSRDLCPDYRLPPCAETLTVFGSVYNTTGLSIRVTHTIHWFLSRRALWDLAFTPYCQTSYWVSLSSSWSLSSSVFCLLLHYCLCTNTARLSQLYSNINNVTLILLHYRCVVLISTTND